MLSPLMNNNNNNKKRTHTSYVCKFQKKYKTFHLKVFRGNKQQHLNNYSVINTPTLLQNTKIEIIVMIYHLILFMSFFIYLLVL